MHAFLKASERTMRIYIAYGYKEIHLNVKRTLTTRIYRYTRIYGAAGEGAFCAKVSG